MPAPTRNLTQPGLVSAFPLSGVPFDCAPVPAMAEVGRPIKRIFSPYYPLSRAVLAPTMAVYADPAPNAFAGLAVSSMLWMYPLPTAIVGQIYPRGAR